jgi:hypothetical protein
MMAVFDAGRDLGPRESQQNERGQSLHLPRLSPRPCSGALRLMRAEGLENVPLVVGGIIPLTDENVMK